MPIFFSSRRALGSALGIAVLTLGACGSDDSAPVAAKPRPKPHARSGCGAGEAQLADGSCQLAGLPLAMGCPPGELPDASGKCEAAGVRPGSCALGFEPAGDGCSPILPSDPC